MKKVKFSNRYQLPNGQYIIERRSCTPILFAVFIGLLILSLQFTQFNFSALMNRGYQFWVIFLQFFPPNINYLSSVLQPLADTIKMSFIGSFLGSILAVPFAVLASNNIVNNIFLNQSIRLLFTILRTLPTLVIALIATYIFGLGTLAGTIAIFLFSFSYVGKQLFEQIETVDLGAFEAIQSMGGSKGKTFTIAIIPQLLPIYITTVLFNFEGNVRYAAILGYVGAGGIGLILNDRLNNRDYESVGMILICLFLCVLIIDNLSQFIRKKLV
ncbi:phosphonate ABC transporter, permease protein PhnE [Enterococcus sp. HY326]|uniref:phosphonate ABC transporter, permease protein PhnE n=1 Tax=Enterococcus sp. HY326 TaxID=2971265 RepID=UPI00223FC7BB|nr:phosphonate ABC transporter, permease protein PhnE [Enterococcus sp. HY326]